MRSRIPPTAGGAPIGPGDLSLPPTQPIDLTPLVQMGLAAAPGAPVSG